MHSFVSRVTLYLGVKSKLFLLILMVSISFQSRSTAVSLHAKLQYVHLYVGLQGSVNRRDHKRWWLFLQYRPSENQQQLERDCLYKSSTFVWHSAFVRHSAFVWQSALSASNYATEMFVQLKPLSQETQTNYGTLLILTKRHNMSCGKLKEIKGKKRKLKEEMSSTLLS